MSAPLYNLLECKDIKLEKLIHRQLYNKFFLHKSSDVIDFVNCSDVGEKMNKFHQIIDSLMEYFGLNRIFMVTPTWHISVGGVRSKVWVCWLWSHRYCRSRLRRMTAGSPCPCSHLRRPGGCWPLASPILRYSQAFLKRHSTFICVHLINRLMNVDFGGRSRWHAMIVWRGHWQRIT